MLKRCCLNLILVVLFAFTQMEVISHEITHFKQLTHQNKTDKNTTSEQCGQCIAYAQSANSTPASSFTISITEGEFHFTTAYLANLTTRLSPSYSARAPPITQKA